MPVKYDTISPEVMENASSMKMAPAIPLMNTSGTNTAMVVSDELSIGVIISEVPATAARFSEYPFSRYCDTFSVTMMALSIIMPTARISPESEITLSETRQR